MTVFAVTRADIVTAARSWLGVPWVHQGRSRAGVDCAGLLLCVGRELGLTELEFTAYGFVNDPAVLTGLCDAHMDRIDVADMAPGDVVTIQYPGVPHHLGIVGDYVHGGLSLVHALNLWGRVVVEHRIDDSWRRRISRAYRVRGVA